eukprot:TRINITY_DN4796_c0_g1_i1.p1 TRINITY_DN4796_c0_g1~~TRINITY_DN4796_c0_g1_i1.p1  ORF type:complete len:368 (-),score=61.98 TRINITY_DN4796_c0_g1_i1:32-1135(-)
MKCEHCEENKLSVEFPYEISPQCEHVCTWCFKCLHKLKQEQQNMTCPECDSPVLDPDSIFSSYITHVLQQDHFKEAQPKHTPSSPSSIKINTFKNMSRRVTMKVTMLDGQRYMVTGDISQSVYDFQQEITKQSTIPVANQRLIYNGQELKGNKTLAEYNIQEEIPIQLMRLLYAINSSSDLDKTTFNLRWGFPGNRRDYLDASCLIYYNDTYVGLVDYECNNQYQILKECRINEIKAEDITDYLRHSGDASIDRHGGFHFIKLSLKSLPRYVTHLFFVLSAFQSSSLAHFPNPQVALVDDSTNRELCQYKISDAGHAQAVIMCCLMRTNDGGWRVESLGVVSSGNAENYIPINTTISGLFQGGLLNR